MQKFDSQCFAVTRVTREIATAPEPSLLHSLLPQALCHALQSRRSVGCSYEEIAVGSKATDTSNIAETRLFKALSSLLPARKSGTQTLCLLNALKWIQHDPHTTESNPLVQIGARRLIIDSHVTGDAAEPLTVTAEGDQIYLSMLYGGDVAKTYENAQETLPEDGGETPSRQAVTTKELAGSGTARDYSDRQAHTRAGVGLMEQELRERNKGWGTRFMTALKHQPYINDHLTKVCGSALRQVLQEKRRPLTELKKRTPVEIAEEEDANTLASGVIEHLSLVWRSSDTDFRGLYSVLKMIVALYVERVAAGSLWQMKPIFPCAVDKSTKNGIKDKEQEGQAKLVRRVNDFLESTLASAIVRCGEPKFSWLLAMSMHEVMNLEIGIWDAQLFDQFVHSCLRPRIASQARAGRTQSFHRDAAIALAIDSLSLAIKSSKP